MIPAGMDPGVSIVIPTLNGGPLFDRSLAAMRGQAYAGEMQIVVIDSGSKDGTPEAARRHGADVASIPPSEFHHARTRNLALRFARHPLLLYTVQDAVPSGREWLAACAAAMEDRSISAASGRQVPHPGADLFSRYISDCHNESLGDRRIHPPPGGLEALDRAGFAEALNRLHLDNVCAIYRKSALEEIPFPEFAIGEDQAWCLKAQRAGHRILYDPAIQVYHSHDRPPEYDFRRALAGFVCAGRILGKLPAERDGFGLDEIHEAGRLTRALARELGASTLQGRIGRRLARKVRRLLPLGRSQTLRLELERSMAFQYAEVLRRYPEASLEERKRFLARLAASEHGKFAAEVFLTREARGDVPPALAKFAASGMAGV